MVKSNRRWGMKRVMGIVLAGWFLLMPGWWTPSAYAAVSDWPVVGQLYKVGVCILADSGEILQSAAKHAAAFGTETLTLVKDCLVATVQVLTPGPDAEVHPHEDAHPHE